MKWKMNKKEIEKEIKRIQDRKTCKKHKVLFCCECEYKEKREDAL